MVFLCHYLLYSTTSNRKYLTFLSMLTKNVIKSTQATQPMSLIRLENFTALDKMPKNDT